MSSRKSSNNNGRAKPSSRPKSSTDSNGSRGTNAQESSREPRLPQKLRHSTEGPTNWVPFKKEAIIYFEAKYGNAGTFIRTGQLWEPPAVPDPLPGELDAENDPHGIKKRIYFKKLEIHESLKSATLDQNVPMSAELQSLCSLPSMEAVKAYVPLPALADDSDDEHESDDEDEQVPGPEPEPLTYANFTLSRNPVQLLRMMEATHSGAIGGSFVDDAIAAIKRYVNLSQSPSESTDQFKERTDNAIIGLESAGVSLFSQQLLAGFYVTALDNGRYATLKSEIRNDETKGLRTRPKTLLQAHNLAIKRMNVVLKGTDTSGAGQQVFVARAANGGGRDRRGGGRNAGAGRGGAGGRGSGGGGGGAAPAASKDKADQPCRLCGLVGHWCAQCPDLERAAEILSKQPKQPAVKHQVTVAIAGLDPDAVAFCAMCGNERALIMRTMGAAIVLLDTGATISVFFNRALLTNVRSTPHPITVHGVGGNIRVDQVGDFGLFGEVYFSADAAVNVLALSKVASEFSVAYHHCADGGAFRVQLSDQSYNFVCEDGLYVCDFQSHFVGVHNTVQEREALYTKREVEAAGHARELARAMGYPSMAHLVKLMSSGAILTLPVTVADLQRAQAIYGPDIGSLKGKTKNRKAKPVTIEHVPAPARKEQELHADIMFINGEPFLLIVSTPLGMTFVRFLKSRTAGILSEALAAIVNELTSRGFKPTTLLSDGEGGISKILPVITSLGMLFNPAGPNMHVPVIENKIKQVKERCRAIINTLPYKLAPFLLKWLVVHVVTRLNMCPSSTRVDPTPPRELFLQRKIDYKLDLRISYGEYAQVNAVNTIRNSMESRTEPAIALTSLGNLQGSFRFYCISTGGLVTRDQWTPLPLPNSVIEHMNKLAAGEKRGASGLEPVFARGPALTEVADLDEVDEQVPFEESARVGPIDPTKAVDDIDIEPSPAPQLSLQLPGAPAAAANAAAAPTATSPVGPPLQQAAEASDDEVPDLADQSSDEEDEATTTEKAPPADDDDMPDLHDEPDSDDEDGDARTPSAPTRSRPSSRVEPRRQDTREPAAPSRYPTRGNRTSWRDNVDKYSLYILASKASEYGLHISVNKALDMFGDKATAAIAAELQQMIDLRVWTPISPISLSPSELKNVIYSSMFLKEKFLPDGEFDKLKARLVANGSQQDKSLYETSNVSSPTVALSSVFIAAGIAAMERRHVVTLDIIGAYLKIPMTGKKVRVRLSPQVAKILCELDPEHEKFLLKDGSLIVLLDKAMYGCLESGKLLFDAVRKTLLDAGFTQNPYDQCVFNRGPLASQTTVCLYVDDLMITGVNSTDVENVVDLITGVYKTVKVNRGKLHSYLGMTLDFSKDGDCKITMDGYVDEVLRFLGVTGTAASPASATLFDVRDTSPPLKETDRQLFHTGVAKLLYLAKRVRPDLLTAVSFLATRATKAAEDDQAKLSRLLKYLNGSKGMGLVLSFDPRMLLTAYVDVSYGVHADAKSHTGGLLSLGGAAFAVKSTKQKLVTKSSTEGELVGVSDYSGEIIEKRNFLIAQGYEMEEATLFQDNMSTIAMIKNGRPTSDRTRHVNIRFFYIKDRVDAGEITVKHMPTANMIADILTKPLQGELFRRLRAALLNWRA